MISPWLIPAGTFGVGLVKGLFDKKSEKKRAKNEALMNAEVMRYSPWTGFSPSKVEAPRYDVLGPALQGGAMGVGLAQNIENSDKMNKFYDKMYELEQRRLGMGGGMAPQAPNFMPQQAQNTSSYSLMPERQSLMWQPWRT